MPDYKLAYINLQNIFEQIKMFHLGTQPNLTLGEVAVTS